jgi:hypothetical protein
MNAPTEVYLDSNAVGHLIPKQDGPTARRRRGALLAAINARRLIVLPSVSLLQELLAIGAVNWRAHLRVIGFLREIASPNILLITRDLARAELQVGRRLAGSERFISAADAKRLWAEVLKPDSVAEVTAAAKAEAARFAARDKALVQEVNRELAAITPKGESVPKNVRAWWLQDPKRHIRDFALKTAQSIANIPDTYPVERLPGLWNFHAYMSGRIYLMHGAHHEIKPTDLADAHHYTAAAYADIFVSGDIPLRKIAQSIPGAKSPITLSEFDRMFLRRV